MNRGRSVGTASRRVGAFLRRRAAGGAVAAIGVLFAVDLHLGLAVSFWGDGRFFVVPAAIVGALVWTTRARWLPVVATALLGALWIAVCFTSLTDWMVVGLNVGTDPEPADAVLVLGSLIQADDELTAVSMTRLVRSLELIGSGYADTLVVTEKETGPRHADVARRLAARLGVPVTVRAVGPVVNTRDEAAAAADLCRQQGICRVLLVTSPTHLRRAAAVFETAGVQVVPVAATESRFDLEDLPRPGGRAEAFGTVLHERLGYWWYVRQGWIDPARRGTRDVTR